MSLYSLRFRRALSLSSSLLNGTRPFSSISAPPPFSSTIIPNPRLDLTEKSHFLRLLNPFQCRSFRSSTVSLSSRPRSPAYDDDKISPDAILFEGCDYNHWLITMDFPKDPKPSPEEMVETYVQTCAKVVGSVEEAKRRIYACSTTTYHGFQVEVTEEMSEKFRGLPGVVFILPDSYIDPVNKEYGGDKYENGKITHRPPPVQYGRQGGRYGDRNRTRGGPYQQGNSGYENQGPMRGGDNRNFGAQQNPQPPQNYGPPGANVRRDPMPMGSSNAPGGQDNYQRERRDPMPPYQRNYAPPQGGNYGQGHGGSFGQGAGGGYGQGVGGAQAQGGVGGYGVGAGGAHGQGVGGSFGQGVGGAQGQGGVGGYGAGAGGAHGQGAGGGYGQGVGGSFGQAAGGTYGQGVGGAQGQGGVGGYGAGAGAGGGYGQGVGGSYGQGAGGSYGQGGVGGYGQEMGSNQGQNDFGHGENQRFSQTEPRESGQGRERNYAATGETGIGQGRY